MTAVELHARATPGFDDRLAATLALLRKAARVHDGRIVQAPTAAARTSSPPA